MAYVRRVTLRCLCEDLTDDWASVAQQRAFRQLRSAVASSGPDSDVASALECLPTTALAEHPLVASFFSNFASDDPGLQRESISGLTNPHWWKQKVSRWRGAATDASDVGEGEAWLCAGGLRASGDQKDFYTAFMKAISNGGATVFLPAAEDRRLQQVEAKVARLAAWEEQLRLAVLICLADADQGGERQTLHVPAPGPEPVGAALAHFGFELARVDAGSDELVELFLYVSDQNHARPSLLQLSVEAARSVLEPVNDAWRVLPGQGTDQIWSALISGEVLGVAQQAKTEGQLPAHLRSGALRLGVQAHYTYKDGIVTATVEGDAVRGLCGTWFVPTANPEHVPLCPACAHLYTLVPSGGDPSSSP